MPKKAEAFVDKVVQWKGLYDIIIGILASLFFGCVAIAFGVHKRTVVNQPEHPWYDFYRQIPGPWWALVVAGALILLLGVGLGILSATSANTRRLVGIF